MIVVRFYGVFRARLGNWVEDLHVAETKVEPGPSQVIHFNLKSCLFISAGNCA